MVTIRGSTIVGVVLSMQAGSEEASLIEPPALLRLVRIIMMITNWGIASQGGGSQNILSLICRMLGSIKYCNVATSKIL